MFVFRLISFAARVIAAFVFVMLLQIPFGGKTMEQRLVGFGKKWTLAKMLNQTGKDGAAAISGGQRLAAEKPGSGIHPESADAVRQLSGAIAPAARGLSQKIKGWLADEEPASPGQPSDSHRGEPSSAPPAAGEPAPGPPPAE